MSSTATAIIFGLLGTAFVIFVIVKFVQMSGPVPGPNSGGSGGSGGTNGGSGTEDTEPDSRGRY